jgi:hypothetical protein
MKNEGHGTLKPPRDERRVFVPRLISDQLESRDLVSYEELTANGARFSRLFSPILTYSHQFSAIQRFSRLFTHFFDRVQCITNMGVSYNRRDIDIEFHSCD